MTLEIGPQIKVLRQQRRITGKDLAHKIGLSQSQMSRLEKGQRRIDTEILARIAAALEVSPAVFFNPEAAADEDPLTPRRERELAISRLHVEVGKRIRSERRKRHLTSDDLARKTGHTKAFVIAVEEGRRNGLEGDFLAMACRILAIDPFSVVEIQERIIRELKTRLHELDRRLATVAPGDTSDDGKTTGRLAGTPILLGDESPYPREFNDEGRPMAAVEGFLVLPDLSDRPTFALRVHGTDMESSGPETFGEGDLLVFATDRSARTGEFAFIRYGEDLTCFRRLYHDDGQVIRLHALRDEVAPILLDLHDVRSAWPLVAHLVSHE